TSGTNPSCSGTSLTFTATSTNGGTTPIYQWQVNGVNDGTNSPTYTSSTLTTGQIVTCILTSNANCATPISATSTGDTMSINPMLVPSVSIALTSGTNPSCSGTSLTFTATPTNGGTTPIFQWQVNGVNDGTNSPTYTSSTLATGQIVTCILTSNANCVSPISANSTGITMSINPLLVPSVSIALTTGTNPTCSGSSLTFTATPTNEGTIPVYQWQVDGLTDGTNSSTFTTSALTNGQIVSCILTSNANCVSSNTATSAGITMNVSPILPVSINIVANFNPACAGSLVTFTATPTNGGTTPAYQWTVNGVNTGANAPSYSDAALANNDVIACILTSNIACSSGNPANSNSITLTVNPIPTTPVITQNFDTLFSSVAFGNQWFMGLPGNPIAGAINQSYVTTSNNDYYVIVTDANGCVSDTSNVFNVFNTNIENHANFSFNIYPNPNNGNFSIQLNNLLDGAADFELFDAIGQLVYKKKLINKNNHEFYLRGVSSGIYTIKITTSENSLTRKLIIQK
ncbi:MAG: T9SS type A sorting domain-containing protein, partial [Bacteroidetes bacterium]|nr:T9SS type A sorting domain-containing protein [Bacteroidota bacterium]